MNPIIEIAKAGLNRFYEEGCVSWTEEKLRVIFGNHLLQEPEIEQVLQLWQANGWIKLSRRSEEYAVVMSIIPDC